MILELKPLETDCLHFCIKMIQLSWYYYQLRLQLYLLYSELFPSGLKNLLMSNNKPPEVVEDSVCADRVRNWFSLLSKEQQSLATRLLVDGVDIGDLDGSLLQV
ncbi:hypothetical protein POM88_033505 [Heracleum sosnowskyi]|uniref:Uncharacterized protein n=1 Tax=Heracleum sosnowskyi TaxID=360622 RepID=A0AAD8MLL7_9APIA|nr:hypothetical protein POM88_033505 [Heracleum sosnowskyi]